jgi:hypothetical protein
LSIPHSLASWHWLRFFQRTIANRLAVEDE